MSVNAELSAAMEDRIERVARGRGAGRSYREIVETERGPLVVEMLTEAMHALETAGSVVRRAEARALHDEGMTMDEIAAAFGVTRQRVSALLREPRPSPLKRRRWTD
ncbi:MAG: helix-turn-helix domain-containing protein [Solirubrobacteraceae bacterium]